MILAIYISSFNLSQTGRIGADAPADNVIATIVSAIGSLALPLVIPLSHRFGPRALKRGAVFMTIVTIGLMAVFARRTPFDEMHQKRLFVLHLENVGFFLCLPCCQKS